MVSVESFIPKIEGFSPLPVAAMIPFMEAQSAALAYAFGINYQYGKRQISAMSNEEFNKLTPALLQDMTTYRTSVATQALKNQIPNSMGLQELILQHHRDIEIKKVDQNVLLLEKTLPILIAALANSGTANTVGGFQEIAKQLAGIISGLGNGSPTTSAPNITSTPTTTPTTTHTPKEKRMVAEITYFLYSIRSSRKTMRHGRRITLYNVQSTDKKTQAYNFNFEGYSQKAKQLYSVARSLTPESRSGAVKKAEYTSLINGIQNFVKRTYGDYIPLT